MEKIVRILEQTALQQRIYTDQQGMLRHKNDIYLNSIRVV